MPPPRASLAAAAIELNSQHNNAGHKEADGKVQEAFAENVEGAPVPVHSWA
jgi:hypothetical protein